MDPRFQHALLTIRMEEIQKEDWEFLQTCVLTQLSPVERAMFDNAVVLLSIKKEVDERNMHMMERVGTPVTKIKALYHAISREEGVKVDSDYCINLEHVLHLSVGCRVITQYLCILMIGYVN